MHKSKLFTLVPVVSMLALASTGALAQTESNEELVLEEVLVTATKMAMSLQEVPVSVAVLDGELLEVSGYETFTDIGFSVGNFVAGSAGTPIFSGVSIRGIQGRAGVYVDDVIVPSGNSYNTTLIDIERVEILRGPQGTTFGSNTIAGAVNTITRKPSNYWRGQADAKWGSYGLQQYRGVVSGPIAEDSVSFKLTGFYRDWDGPDQFIESRKDANGDSEQGIGGSILFNIGDNFDLWIKGDHSELEVKNGFVFDFLNETPGSLVPILSTGFFSQLGYDNDPFELNENPYDRKVWDTHLTNRLEREIDTLSAQINWGLNTNLELVSITAYNKVDVYSIVDEDRLPTYLADNEVPSEDKQFTQELRLIGNYDKFNWILGGFYMDQETDSGNLLRYSPLALQLTLDPTFSVPWIPGLIGIGGVERSDNTTTNKELAAYGSFGWNFAENWKLTVGGRYTDASIERTEGVTVGAFPGSSIVFNEQGAPDLSTLDYYTFPKSSDSRFDPSASLNWFATDEMNFYAAYSTGFRRPTYNSRFVCENQGSGEDVPSCFVKPEEAENFEVGMKSQFLNDSLRLNVVGYHMKYKDLQRSQGIITEGNFTGRLLTTNVDATSQGIEVEGFWLPNEWLTWDLSLGYQDATYDNSVKNTNVPVGNEDGSGTILIDARGATLPGAPEWTGSTNLTAQTGLFGNYDGLFRVELQWRSEYVNGLGPNPAQQVDSQTNLNLVLGLMPKTERGFGAMFRVMNTLDNQYFTNASGVANIGQFITLSSPRTYSLELYGRF